MNKKAFTLIELLTVIFIIGIMASVGVFNYNHQKKRDLFEQGVLEFVSDLRYLQNLAQTVKEIDTGGQNDICDEYVLGLIEQEVDGPNIADSYKLYCLRIGAGSGVSAFQTKKLPTGVRFIVDDYAQNIHFIPPIPENALYNSLNERADSDGFYIESTQRSDLGAVIKISNSGRVSINYE